MNIGTRTHLLAAALLGLAALAQAATVNVTAVGVYDATGGANNAVDIESVNNSVSLADFKTDMSDAFANGTGGVIDFNGFSGSPAILAHNDDLVVSYGGGSRSLTLTNVSESAEEIGSGGSDRTAISGAAEDLMTSGASIGGATIPQQNFKFDVDAGAYQVDSIGLTVVSRAVNKTLGIMPLYVTLDDASTVTINHNFDNQDMTGQNATLDLFYSYTAPTGRHIVGFEADLDAANTGYFSGIDDVGFTTVPEPSTVAMVAMALTVFGATTLRRRRRA